MPRKNNNDSNPTGFDLAAVPDAYRDRVENLIPSPSIGERYINRILPGGFTDFDVFDMAMATRHNILLPGPTGSGKTTALRAYASARRIPYVSVELNGAYDHASVVGRTTIGKDGLPEFTPGSMTLAVQYGGVVDLAECAFAPPRFMASFYGVTDSRQALFIQEIGEAVPKHKACLIGANYNPGYQGTVQLNPAFTNRFAVPVKWEYDPAVEEALIGPYSMRLLNTVRGLRNEATIRTDIGTNRMEEFIQFATMGNIKLAIALFVGGFGDAEQPIVTKVMEANAQAIERELDDLDSEEVDADAIDADAELT